MMRRVGVDTLKYKSSNYAGHRMFRIDIDNGGDGGSNTQASISTLATKLYNVSRATFIMLISSCSSVCSMCIMFLRTLFIHVFTTHHSGKVCGSG